MNKNFLTQVDGTWSLFLDRDGVINRRIINGYVRKPEEMVLLPQVKEAFEIFHRTFRHIFIVTNQQGIGKGIMTEEELHIVHQYMLQLLHTPVTHIYYCPALASANSSMRKPRPGMALQAQKDYPDVDFSRSIMVGDAHTDMEFGINAGMHTVFIPCVEPASPLADLQCSSLYHLATLLP